MSVFTIPRQRFDWERFVGTVSHFALSRGADEPLPVAEDGKVVFAADHEELTLPAGMELEDIPVDPTERLEVGFNIFAPFAMFHDFDALICADGGTIEMPDLDELDDEFDEDDEERPRLTDAHRRLMEKTVCDECRSYGFQVSLEGANLVLQTMLMSESDGECAVEAVADAGLVEGPMAGFINSFVRKPARKRL